MQQENQLLIKDIMKQNPGLSLVSEQVLIPEVETQDRFDHDGGYAVLLEKK
jgi:hypothetical protein